MTFAPYRDRSRAAMLSALRWARAMLHLREWNIRFTYSNRLIKTSSDFVSDPACCATCEAQHRYLTATIDIAPARCEQRNLDPITCLFHELIHLPISVFDDASDSTPACTNASEQVVNCWEMILYALYSATKGKPCTQAADAT